MASQVYQDSAATGTSDQPGGDIDATELLTGNTTQTAMEDDELEEDEEQDQEGYESSSSPSTSTSTLTWITWFCSLPGHEYFCEVAEDFIEDDFNLTGLSSLVPFYKEAMEMVLDVEAEEEAHRVPDVSIVESSAELLYGLIHQRYIITRQGLQQMFAKYEAGHFGNCPRVYCSQTKLLPCGRSDLPGVDTVKLYCPSCVDMYVPPSSRFQGVDGAFFGTTFPHLLFQTYPSALAIPSAAISTSADSSTAAGTSGATAAGPSEGTTPVTSLTKVYIPKIYGFKVSEKARSGPRMQWLRMRPRHEAELDWADADRPDQLPGDDDDDPESRGAGKERGAFDSGPEDEEEDEEEEEEEEQDEGAQAANQGDDAMKDQESHAVGGVTPGADERESRSIRPMPRTSFGGGAASGGSARSVDAQSISKSIEAAVSTGVQKPPRAVLAETHQQQPKLVSA